MDKKRIRMAMEAKTSVFSKFTHEKERSIAWLRLAVAEFLSEDNLLIDGASGHLIPQTISHVLRICVVADRQFRLAHAQKERGLSEKAALSQIRKSDEDLAVWVNTLHKNQDPWDPSLYDIVIPANTMEAAESVALIEGNLRNEVIRPTQASQKAAEDFSLVARVGVALAREGHNVEVTSRDGAVTITINQNVLMLSRLEDELKSVAEAVDGVRSVETHIGKGFYKADIYRKYDFDVPKLLLVDDEQDFLDAMATRMKDRGMEVTATTSAADALKKVEGGAYDAVVLDLSGRKARPNAVW